MIIRTGDSQTMNQVANLIHRLDVPTPLVLLEVKVMSIVLDDEFRSVFDYQYSDGGTVAGSSMQVHGAGARWVRLARARCGP